MLLRQFASGSIPHSVTVDNDDDFMNITSSIMTIQMSSCVSGRKHWTEKRNCRHYIYCNKDFFPKTDTEDTDFTQITKLSVCNIQELWPVEPKWDWVAAGKMSAILKNAEITKVASGKGQGCRVQPARLPPHGCQQCAEPSQGTGPSPGALSAIQRHGPSLVAGFIFTHWRVKHTTHSVIHGRLSWSVLKGGKKELTELDWISLVKNKMCLFMEVWHQFVSSFSLDCCPPVRQDTAQCGLTAHWAADRLREMAFLIRCKRAMLLPKKSIQISTSWLEKTNFLSQSRKEFEGD